jgi:manganese/zinc/iron transport system substrate-binding protein
MARLLLCLMAVLMAACESARPCISPEQLRIWMSDNGKVKVLSTIAMLEDVVKEIGGDRIDTISLISGQLDPHSYQLVKGDDEKFQYAQVIFFSGLGLEHGASLQHHLENNPKAIGVGDLIREKNPSRILEFNGQLDPHIWMDISLWAEGVDPIVAKLSEVDPAHASEYRSRGDMVRQKLLEKHQQLRQMLQAIPSAKRYLVTSHDAFNYFALAYLAEKSEQRDDQWTKRFQAPEGLAPDSQLSTTDIQKIIDHLALYHIEVLFPESNVSRDSIRKIVDAGKEKGLNLVIAKEALFGDAMGCPGTPGDSYLKMLEHNAQVIVQYLK